MSSENTGERLIAIKEARERMGGAGQATVYEEINSGRLPAVKVGRRTYIRESALMAWINSRPAFKTKAA